MSYIVEYGWDDGSEKDEREFSNLQDADEFFDEIDLKGLYVTEWNCLPTGGREHHKKRRAEKKLIYMDTIMYDVYGFKNYRREQEEE